MQDHPPENYYVTCYLGNTSLIPRLFHLQFAVCMLKEIKKTGGGEIGARNPGSKAVVEERQRGVDTFSVHMTMSSP